MARNGPKPLPFQLGMASLASAGLAGGTAFGEDTLQAFFKGIQKYQQHSYIRSLPALPVVWEAGRARLLYAAAEKRLYDTPVFLIPSMVNGYEILDLHPDRSLVRWLAAQGFDVYLLDWGAPAEDPEQADFDLALQERLIPAIESLGRAPIMAGYCMGGMFAAALSAVRPDLVKACLLIATPWNFHDEKAALKARMMVMKPMAIPYMTQYRKLPESWMQAVFATLDPEGSIKKFASFCAMDDQSLQAEIFVAVEDWLNEGLDLPAGIARLCMEEWYGDNRPAEGTWTVMDTPVRAADLRVPTCTVMAKDDRIVPIDSAMAFAQQRVKNHTILCDTGHVGLIASRKAVEDIWPLMRDWFAVQQ